MAKWREYQEEAASFFRSLGLEAETDAHVSGVRGRHAVDVFVRTARAGISQAWVVECKCWSKKVDKVHVAALAEIVRDVGADRGLLLSEIGFQAGAIRMADKSNVTLTSLEDLRMNAADELVELGLDDCGSKLVRLQERVSSLTDRERAEPNRLRSTAKPGASMKSILGLYGIIGFAERALKEAELGHWPVLYGFDPQKDRGLRASNNAKLLTGLRQVIDQVEEEVASQEHAIAECSARE